MSAQLNEHVHSAFFMFDALGTVASAHACFWNVPRYLTNVSRSCLLKAKKHRSPFSTVSILTIQQNTNHVPQVQSGANVLCIECWMMEILFCMDSLLMQLVDNAQHSKYIKDAFILSVLDGRDDDDCLN